MQTGAQSQMRVELELAHDLAGRVAAAEDEDRLAPAAQPHQCPAGDRVADDQERCRRQPGWNERRRQRRIAQARHEGGQAHHQDEGPGSRETDLLQPLGPGKPVAGIETGQELGRRKEDEARDRGGTGQPGRMLRRGLPQGHQQQDETRIEGQEEPACPPFGRVAPHGASPIRSLRLEKQIHRAAGILADRCACRRRTYSVARRQITGPYSMVELLSFEFAN